MLISETRNTEVESLIREAVIERFKTEDFELVFEHDQWWLQLYDEYEDETRTFSVCDAEGYGSIMGLDFEEV